MHKQTADQNKRNDNTCHYGKTKAKTTPTVYTNATPRSFTLRTYIFLNIYIYMYKDTITS